VYSVIEPHGVRYKQGMGRREFGRDPIPRPEGANHPPRLGPDSELEGVRPI